MSLPRIGDRMGANEGLPWGYRRCEYLESTGTQYIDTGFTATKNTGLYAEWMFNGQGKWDNEHVLSCVNLYCPRPRKVDNVWVAQGVLGLGSGSSANFELTFGKKNISSTNFQNSKTINFNETSVKLDKALGSGQDKVILCGYTDLSFYYLFHGYIYSAKISEGTEIVRNLIPALDPNNRPCMFDTVTSTPLYNQGTGEFLYKVISPETAYIPANFTRVGYLESNGTQYIDTGINLSSESEVRCEFERTAYSTDSQAVFGVYAPEPRYALLCNLAGDSYLRLATQSGYIFSKKIQNGEQIKFCKKNANVYINDELVGTFIDQNETSVSCRIFSAAPAYCANARIYSFSISRNGQLQCNLIPCLDGDNVPCMYDTVLQRALYKTAGDQFLYGEDEKASKKLPAGYTKMNYLESTGTQWIDTCIVPKIGDEFNLDFSINEIFVGNYPLFSAGDGQNQLVLVASRSESGPENVISLYLRYFRNDASQTTFAPFQKINCKIDKDGKIFINGNYGFQSPPLGEINTSLLLFKRVAQTLFFHGRIYSFSISRNGELQLDLQPCLDPYGFPCMYDFVSKRPLYKEDNGDDGDQFLYG